MQIILKNLFEIFNIFIYIFNKEILKLLNIFN